MSTFYKLDISKFKKFDDPNEARVYFQSLAHAAESADRFDDMCIFMIEVVKASVHGPDLSFDERNLLSISFKNTVSTLRNAWRNIQSANDRLDDSIYVAHLRHRVESELFFYCKSVLDLLEQYLIPHSSATVEARVFYLKMAGDYYRYLSEFNSDSSAFRNSSCKMYDKAMETAEHTIPPNDPVRLGLALNYSVCLYEIMKDTDRAIALAQSAHDAAREASEQCPNPTKDSELILKLLHDNLDLWNTLSNEVADGEPNE